MDDLEQEFAEVAERHGLSEQWMYKFPDECPHCGAPPWAKYCEGEGGLICEYCDGEILAISRDA